VNGQTDVIVNVIKVSSRKCTYKAFEDKRKIRHDRNGFFKYFKLVLNLRAMFEGFKIFWLNVTQLFPNIK
jgi:hypothetical protein